MSTKQVTSEKSKKGFFSRNIGWMLIISVLVAGMLFTYFRSRMSLQKMNEVMRTHQENLEESVNEFLLSNTEDLLMLSTKGLNWAIRGELIRGNEEQIQQYLSQLVKEKGVEHVEFINSEGIIEMSSNKKKEGQKFNLSGYEENPLVKDKAFYSFNEDGTVNLFAPIMGLEKRLGTLMILYTPDQFVFESGDDLIDDL